MSSYQPVCPKCFENHWEEVDNERNFDQGFIYTLHCTLCGTIWKQETYIKWMEEPTTIVKVGDEW